jgi:hypothetical protein
VHGGFSSILRKLEAHLENKDQAWGRTQPRRGLASALFRSMLGLDRRPGGLVDYVYIKYKYIIELCNKTLLLYNGGYCSCIRPTPKEKEGAAIAIQKIIRGRKARREGAGAVS